MYYDYFGLKEAPFSIAVDPRYLFMSARHRDALAHLIYGIGEGGGFILLTGEVGTGKTTINRCLLKQLPENIDLALILNPALDVPGLLATMCDELGIEYNTGETNLKILTDKLHQFLLANHKRGRNTVLLIDEAQHLQPEVLEQIRLLTNLETDTKKLLQIVLVGQPELRSMLARPELRQLSQRITARYDLKPLSLLETEAYINHRLQMAGLPANQQLFPRSMIKRIHKACAGIPRVINVLCDRILLGAYGKNKSKVDKKIFQQALEEVLGDRQDVISNPFSYRNAITFILVCGLAGLIWAWQSKVPTMAFSKDVAGKQINEADSPPDQAIAQPLVNNDANGTQKIPSFLYRNQAVSRLHDYLGISVDQFCADRADSHWRCETFIVDSWDELIAYNRPAVIKLIGKDKFIRYAVLVGITSDKAVLISEDSVVEFPFFLLGEMWTGDFMFVWNVENGYQDPIVEGERSATIAWLAKAFSKIDNQQEALSNGYYNAMLLERVKIFQARHDLMADGVVGIKTLLKMNEVLRLDKPLDSQGLFVGEQL